MTVNELRDLLDRVQGFDEAQVLAYDADAGELMPVTGVVYGTEKDGTRRFVLQTDDNQ